MNTQNPFKGLLMVNKAYPLASFDFSSVWKEKLLYPFNGLFQDNLGKPFCILMKYEMMGWQWYQQEHMQIIYTSLQRDNHASTSPLKSLQAKCPSCHPTNSVKALKAFWKEKIWGGGRRMVQYGLPVTPSTALQHWRELSSLTQPWKINFLHHFLIQQMISEVRKCWTPLQQLSDAVHTSFSTQAYYSR